MTMITAKMVLVMNSTDTLIVEALVKLFATRKCVAVGLGILTGSKATEKEILEMPHRLCNEEGRKISRQTGLLSANRIQYRDC
jgi:hypothetical protein